MVWLLGGWRGRIGNLQQMLIRGLVREFRLPFVRGEKSAMEGGEEPALDFGGVADLMALSSPDIEGVLGKIPGIGFDAGEAESEAEERLVVLLNYGFEGHGKEFRI